MKKVNYFKALWGSIFLIMAIVALSGCGKIPSYQKENSWTSNGLTLKWGYNPNSPQNGSVIGGKVNQTIVCWVSNSSGQIVDNVTFDFGDNSAPVIGSQVIHKWMAVRVYTLTATINGTSLCRSVVISAGGTVDEAIILLSGTYDSLTHTNTMVLGLNREKISDTTGNGWYFYWGNQYNNWSWPPLILPNSTVVNGHIYNIYNFSMANGWNKFVYGKFFPNGNDTSFAYAPSSIYWHNGQFWVYVYKGAIYDTVTSTQNLPGKWGDLDSIHPWTIRGTFSPLSDSLTSLTLFINKVYFQNPNNPDMKYSLNEGTAWQTIPLIDQGTYYSVTASFPYWTYVWFNFLSRHNDLSSGVDLSYSTLYDQSLNCGVLEIASGKKK